jgi:hypothetical protein
MKKAEKKGLVSLTQWKPDYEGASTLYEQAATQYKNSNRKKQAAVAFEKLATCKEKLGEYAPVQRALCRLGAARVHARAGRG